MKIAVVIDPIDTLNPQKDSTIALLRAAQKRACTLFFMTPVDLFSTQKGAFAIVKKIKVNSTNAWFDIIEEKEMPLSHFDVIFMRKDPPFNMHYIYTTYLLELAEKKGVKVINKPQSLRDANEKYFTLQFAHCIPETLISQNIMQLRRFYEKHKNIIVKPLDGMGGQSVFHLRENEINTSVILETLTEQSSTPIMAQCYIKEMTSTGDKRILLINGKPIPYALARMACKNDFRGNLAQGGKGKVVPLSKRDIYLCDEIAPTLKNKGLYFVGIDVIGDYITEINVTSPTCIQEIEKETACDIAGEIIDGLLN